MNAVHVGENMPPNHLLSETQSTSKICIFIKDSHGSEIQRETRQGFSDTEYKLRLDLCPLKMWGIRLFSISLSMFIELSLSARREGILMRGTTTKPDFRRAQGLSENETF